MSTTSVPGLREAEQKTAAVLCIYAIAGLSSQFRGAPRSGKIEPAWALFVIAQAMDKPGWERERNLALDTLVWIHRKTSHVDTAWDHAFATGYSDAQPKKALALLDARDDVFRVVGDAYPTLAAAGIQDPWAPISSLRKS